MSEDALASIGADLLGKDGKIVWQGHPMQLEEAQIEQVLK